MYRLRDIQEKLLHLVGWEQPFDPAEQIKDELTQSESGLFFQNQHALLTLTNIKAVMPEDFLFQYPNWNMISEYKAGAKVRHNDKIWIATTDNQNVEPTRSDFNNDFNYDYGSDIWMQYNFLNDYLERETKAGIATMVQTFITKKLLTQETRNILDTRALFDGAGRLQATIEANGKVCGYEITPVRSMGITTKINRIGLQMTGGSGVVRMYIFHSNFKQPVKTYDFNVKGTNGYQWFETPDLYLHYIDDEKNAGGSWFICYNQNDLPAGLEAVDISRDWSREPCGSCNKGDVQWWREITKYFEVHPFKHKATTDFAEYPEMWDIDENIYNGVNYGINFELTVGCDLTDFIIKQRNIFADVLAKQVTYNLLKKMSMNPETRVNRNQLNASRLDLLYELDGNTAAVQKVGLGNEIDKVYKALELDTKGLDRICLGCQNGGIKIRTV